MVFATIDDNNTQLGYIGDVSNVKGSYNDASVVTAKAVKAESREPADDSSESDEGGFDDFMAFLATPSPTSSPEAPAPKKVVDNVAPLVQAVPLSEPAKAAPSARRGSAWAAAAENVSTKKAAPTYIETLSADAAPVKAVPAEKKIQTDFKRTSTTATQASTIIPDVKDDVEEEASLSSESSEEEDGEWSSDEEDGTEAEDEALPAPAPMMKSVLVKESASATVTKPSRRESAPTVAAAAKKAEPRFDLPKSASVATIHFSEQELQKAAEIEAARGKTYATEPMEPLPVDHFTKLGDAQMAAKAEESRMLSEAQMPIGTKYFTELAVAEKEKALAEIRAVSESERSVATKYFMKLEAEKKASSQNGGECDIMPAAIQKFTLEDRAIKEKKRAEIQAMCESPPDMPDGQAYFTNQMRAEKEKTRQELEELKNNPPPASVATEYFKIKESERQLDIDNLMNQPAPPAIEYFTKMANEEKEKARAAQAKVDAEPYEPAAATKYFAEQELQKAAEIEAARAQVMAKRLASSNQPKKINWAELTQQKAPTVPAYY